LSAKEFDDAGKVIAETKVETKGDATQIQLTPDRKTINADGQDVSVFTVSADGFAAATEVAQTQPCAPRPPVPSPLVRAGKL
jgi:beta-galactosidase